MSDFQITTQTVLIDPKTGLPTRDMFLFLNSLAPLTSTSGAAGFLPVAAGGTGAGSLTGYVKGNGTAAFSAASEIPKADVTGINNVDNTSDLNKPISTATQAVLDELMAESFVSQAIAEILNTYADTVVVKNKSLLKFGQNDSVGSSSQCTIMELGGSETEETYLATNAIDSLVCTDGSFTGNIYIEGHSISGGLLTFQTQTVAANGQTRVPLTIALARASRMECADTGTFSTPADDKVYVYENTSLSSGVPSDATKIHLIMSAFERQSKKASTALSSTDYAAVTKIYADVNKKTSATCDIRFRIRQLTAGGGFKTKLIRTLSTDGSNHFEFEPRPFIIIPKNSDVIMTGLASTTGVSVSAGFNSLLLQVQ
jgi:hypothetical protein